MLHRSHRFIRPATFFLHRNHGNFSLRLKEATKNQNKLGKPFVYKTPPRWWPCGDSFWGADGWFFIQGWDKEKNTEYHKVRPKMKK